MREIYCGKPSGQTRLTLASLSCVSGSFQRAFSVAEGDAGYQEEEDGGL
jgi:hypothetical protein